MSFLLQKNKNKKYKSAENKRKIYKNAF